jgi:uncharacterized protein YodC (DUF2158 family)
MEEIKPGDIVELKSGGPNMTVRKQGTSDQTLVQCDWFVGDGEIKTHWFPKEALKKVDRNA